VDPSCDASAMLIVLGVLGLWSFAGAAALLHVRFAAVLGRMLGNIRCATSGDADTLDWVCRAMFAERALDGG
jgi:hypothetical protein